MVAITRKPLSALALITLLFLFAVACGGSDLTGEEQQTSSEAAETAAAQPEGRLLIWAEEANQDVWENTVLPAFQEQYPQVEVVIENYTPADVAYNIGLARRVNRPIPDLAVSHYRHIQNLIARQDLMEITPWMEDHAEQFNPDILDYCYDDGAYYCLPWYVGPAVMFYRRDIFELANLPSDPESVGEFVSTWDGYIATCLEIRRRTGLLCMPYTYQSLLIDMMWQQGIGFVDEEGAVNIDDPAIIPIFEKMNAFRERRVVRFGEPGPEAWEEDLSSDIDNTATPPVASVIYPAWLGYSLKHQFATNQEGNWGVAPMPAWEEGGVRASMGGGSAFFIPKESSNPEAARAFMEFMALDEQNQLAQFAYSDYLPALTTTYEDPLFFEEDPFYDNQKTRLLFLKAMNNVPDTLIFKTGDYQVIIDALDQAVDNFFANRMDAQQALQGAAEAVRLKLAIK